MTTSLDKQIGKSKKQINSDLNNSIETTKAIKLLHEADGPEYLLS